MVLVTMMIMLMMMRMLMVIKKTNAYQWGTILKLSKICLPNSLLYSFIGGTRPRANCNRLRPRSWFAMKA